MRLYSAPLIAPSENLKKKNFLKQFPTKSSDRKSNLMFTATTITFQTQINKISAKTFNLIHLRKEKISNNIFTLL